MSTSSRAATVRMKGKTLRRREHRIRMPGQAVGKQVPGGAIRKRLPPCETGREPVQRPPAAAIARRGNARTRSEPAAGIARSSCT